jgi:hypothetical protein
MTRKDEITRKVILQRTRAIDLLLKNNANLSPNERAYYLGKREGLMQGHDLAGSTLKSIAVELEDATTE